MGRALGLEELILSFDVWMHKHLHSHQEGKNHQPRLHCKTGFCTAELGPNVGNYKTAGREGKQ